MDKLDGKVAVITGGASGIGHAAVRLFVEEGCRVVIADLQDDKGAALAEELGGKSASYLHVDVSREADVSGAIAQAVARFGRLDCGFNNAGPGAGGGAVAGDREADRIAEVMKTLLVARQPIQRAGLPEDIARAALWLASNDSAFVNGHALIVDGGLTGGRMWSVVQEQRQQLRQALGLGE